MRKTLCASALVLALCGSTFAGDMGCPPIVISDPPSPLTTSQSSDVQLTDGSTGAGTPGDPTAGTDALAAFTLSVVNSVLALL